MSVRHQADTALRRAVDEAISRGLFRSQSHMARVLDINESQMSRYVNGLVPKPDTQAKLARALAVDAADLWPVVVRQESSERND